MKENLKIVLCIFTIVVTLITFTLNNDGLNYEDTSDALIFKEEYESLNNDYLKLEISSDNPIKYSSIDEVIDRIENESGVIYLGYASDSLSRSIVPVLLQAADDAGLESVYYCDISEENEDSEQYKKLLDILDDYYDFDNKIDVPCLIFVYDGEIVGVHLGSVESYEDSQIELTDEQYEELYNIYTDYIHVVLNDLCDEKC